MSKGDRPPSDWGTPKAAPEPPGLPATVGVSLVTGVVGLCCSGLFIAPIVAIITGQMALNEISDSGGALEGRRLAQAGRILGVVGLLLGVLFWVLVAVGHSPLPSHHGH